jgi:uncharacterized protein YjbJ (UPF0337 family)
MSKTQEKAEGFTRQVIGQMIGDDLLVQEGKELEQKAKEEDKDENVAKQRPQPSKERSPQPPSRKDKGKG